MTKEQKFRYMFELESGKIISEILTLEQIENGFVGNVYMAQDNEGDKVKEVLARSESTGLFDKSGKEIYIGDVIHYVARQWDWNMEIVFGDGGYAARKDGRTYELCKYAIESSSTFEVVGTAIENPDLLK